MSTSSPPSSPQPTLPPAPPCTPASTRPVVETSNSTATPDLNEVDLSSPGPTTPSSSSVETAAALTSSLDLNEVKSKLAVSVPASDSSNNSSTSPISIPPSSASTPGTPQATPVPHNTPLMNSFRENYVDPTLSKLTERFPGTSSQIAGVVDTTTGRVTDTLAAAQNLTASTINNATTFTSNLTASVKETTTNSLTATTSMAANLSVNTKAALDAVAQRTTETINHNISEVKRRAEETTTVIRTKAGEATEVISKR